MLLGKIIYLVDYCEISMQMVSNHELTDAIYRKGEISMRDTV
jgi:hypothetical protein